jgi:hypothetical protein
MRQNRTPGRETQEGVGGVTPVRLFSFVRGATAHSSSILLVGLHPSDRDDLILKARCPLLYLPGKLSLRLS